MGKRVMNMDEAHREVQRQESLKGTPDQYAKFIESLPSDLAEQVKGFMRAGMDAVDASQAGRHLGGVYHEHTHNNMMAFRRLSEATEVKS